MEPQAGRRISPFRTTKRSNHSLRKTTRRSRVHVQTIGLNAETKKCRHRADGEICLLTFPFIGLLRLPRFLSGFVRLTKLGAGIWREFFKDGVVSDRLKDKLSVKEPHLTKSQKISS